VDDPKLGVLTILSLVIGKTVQLTQLALLKALMKGTRYQLKLQLQQPFKEWDYQPRKHLTIKNNAKFHNP
jgi:hypothetical protein